MPPIVPKNAEIYVDGYDLACALTELTKDKTADEKDATTLCNDGNSEWLPGKKDGSLNMSGFFDFDAVDEDRIGNIMDDAFENQDEVIVSASYQAAEVGDVAFMARGCPTEYSVQSEEGEIVATSAVIRGKPLHGQWVYKGSADDDTDEGDSVDNGAETENGGVLHFHQYLEDDSDATDGEILVEHSDDDVTFETLIATEAIGAENGAIVVEVPYGTTIKRYTKTSYTAVGGKGYAVAAFYRFL